MTNYSKYKDFSATPTPSNYKTMQDYIYDLAIKGEFSRNAVIQFTNEKGDSEQALWTGSKFL